MIFRIVSSIRLWASCHALLLILLLALGLRLLLWSQPLHQLANDEVEYVTVARDLLAGRGWQFYEHYHWLRAPLYPLFLAASLWLAGGDLHRAALPNIAASVATVYLSYRLARALVGHRAALLAALLTAILLTLATFASLYMSETLFTLLFTAGLLCLLRRPPPDPSTPLRTSDGPFDAAQDKRLATVRSWLPIILAGALFGLATLTRSMALLFLPIAALWLFIVQRPGIGAQDQRMNERNDSSAGQPIRAARRSALTPRLLAPAAFLLAAALVIAPWTIRNYIAYGRVIWVETGLSYNLWAFNEPREDQETIFRVLENIPNPAERSDYATARGLARLREDPAILARKIGPSWIYLWRVKAIEDRFIQESYYSDVGLPIFVAALIFDDALYVVIALASVAGLALLPYTGREGEREGLRPSRSALMLAWLIYAITTMLLTHAETRYRHFLFPVLIPYAAWALLEASRPGDQEIRRSSARPVSSRLALLVITILWPLIAGVVVVYYPWGWAGQNLARGWHMLSAQVAWAAGDHDTALREDERAIAAHETPDGWIQLGNHAHAAGDTKQALHAYRKATDIAPPYVAAVADLGDLLRETGDLGAARDAFVGDYVDQQRLADWSWRELRPVLHPFLDVGDGLDFGYVGGVYPAEQQQDASARWTRGRALLRLRGSGAKTSGSVTLQLRLAAPRPDRASTLADICLSGRCQSLSIGPTWRTYLLSFDLTSSEPLLVELRSDTFAAPDGRRLGVMIDWADVHGP